MNSRSVWTVNGLDVTMGGYSLSNQFSYLLPGSRNLGLLGYDQLRHFRVTIDYPHKEVLLEPN